MRTTVLVLSLIALPALAAAISLSWSPSTTYEDGTPIEPGTRIVYLIYDSSTNKQLGSTFGLGYTPPEGCYYLRAAVYSPLTNGIVPATESLTKSNTKCTTPPSPVTPPAQKRVAAPVLQ